MPMPVMQPCRAASLIRGDLLRDADVRSHFQHAALEFLIGETDHAVHDGGVADNFTVNFSARLRHGETGAFVDAFGVELELVARFYEVAKFGVANAGEERH